MKISLDKTEYIEYMTVYLSLIEDTNLSVALHKSLDLLQNFLETIPNDKGLHSYKENKWTINELLQHLIDCERIFNYRALTFVRESDDIALKGFEHNDYVINSKANEKNLPILKEELLLVRKSSIYLFDSFNEEELLKKGKINGANVSVRAIGFAIVGHTLHHCKFISNHYLS